MVQVLETERLILRRIDEDDAGFMLRLLNDPSFLRFIGDRGVRTIEDARRYIRERIFAGYEQHGFGFYMVEIKGAATSIGICGLVKREELDDVDVGFAFLPEFRSQGYAFESAAAVMSYARKTLGLKRIVAITAPDNRASIRLLGKIGLSCERMIRMPGEEQDITLYAWTDLESG